MLFMIEKTEGMFGGSVAEVVPVAEGGCGKAGEKHVPRVVGRDFPRILATLQTQLKAQGLGAVSEAKKDLLHAGPTFVEGFFPGLDGGDFLADKRAGAELACQGERFQGIVEVAGAGGAKVKNDEAGPDRGRGLERGQGVAFGQVTGGEAGIGKFVGVGVGAKEFDGDGAKVVEDVDLGGVGQRMFGQDSGPEAEAGVMAELDVMES